MTKRWIAFAAVTFIFGACCVELSWSQNPPPRPELQPFRYTTEATTFVPANRNEIQKIVQQLRDVEDTSKRAELVSKSEITSLQTKVLVNAADGLGFAPSGGPVYFSPGDDPFREEMSHAVPAVRPPGVPSPVRPEQPVPAQDIFETRPPREPQPPMPPRREQR